MSSFTDYLEAALLNHVFRNVALTSPATIRVALFTVAPGEAGGGTEVTGAGYARQPITFGAPSGGQIANTGAVTFTASGGNFGTIAGAAIFDAASGGNMLAYRAVATSGPINDGDSVTIAVGAFTISLN